MVRRVSPPLHSTLYTLHSAPYTPKNHPRSHFYLVMSKKCCIFALVISPRLGIMSFGWDGCRHNKASLRALCLALRTWKIHKTSNAMQHFDVLGICISISIRTIVVCTCAYISAWASVLLVRNNGQFQGLVKRNSNSASPAFFVCKTLKYDG